MEYLKVVAAENRGSPKKKKNESRSQRELKKNYLLDAIAQASKLGANVVVSHTDDVDGRVVVRMKIVLKKQDFKQILMSMSPTENSVERRLVNLMRKRQQQHLHNHNHDREHHRSSWSPVLQSIPE